MSSIIEQLNIIELEKVRLCSKRFALVRYCSITNEKCFEFFTIMYEMEDSEIERSTSFDLQKLFCEFDFVRLRSAIE